MVDTARPADSRQLVRQWSILRLLADSGRSFSVKELAEQLDTSKSTIQRDLATLERDFALVEESAGRQKKVYRVDQKVRALDAVQFGTMELLALHAALSGLASLAGTPLFDDLHSLQRKLRGFLSPKHNGGLDAISRVFHAHPRGYVDYAGHAEMIDELADAIARRRICRGVYHAAWKGTVREHSFRPLRLVWHRSALYLLACLADATDITTLAVHRFRSLEVTDAEFAAPRVDIAAHVQKAFGIFVSDDEEDVEIVFAPEVAWQVDERIFHPGEQKQPLDDGRLRYRIRSSAQWEIIPWVMRFGPFAELVRPAGWRQALAENAAALVERHRPG